jgi:putative multiple sugar transport system substrate-binding protein
MSTSERTDPRGSSALVRDKKYRTGTAPGVRATMRRNSVRKLLATLAGTALALSLTACGSSDGGGSGGDKGTIGVAMPTKSSERWIADGNNIKKQLEAAGYKVDLQYAEDDIPTQVSQVENMVTKGEKMLVIAAIDGTALGDVLDTAKSSDIPVIAYDRLIRDTDAVDYYTTFDNEKVGELQAQSLVDGLKATGKAPYNVELFAGSPDDNNATFFWNGAMKVLQPMIDSGDMKVVSGQTDFKQAAILRWDPATAQKRMEDILTKSYTNETVQGVLSPYDGLSLGIIAALKANGYGGGDKPLPVVTGQDAEVQSVKSILQGEQYSTIFKDTRELAKVTVSMIKAIGADKKPEVNDTKTYDNGDKVVPSYLLDPVPVTKADVTKALVDTGYYKASQLQ